MERHRKLLDRFIVLKNELMCSNPEREYNWMTADLPMVQDRKWEGRRTRASDGRDSDLEMRII
jgi:hypothetical protein